MTLLFLQQVSQRAVGRTAIIGQRFLFRFFRFFPFFLDGLVRLLFAHRLNGKGHFVLISFRFRFFFGLLVYQRNIDRHFIILTILTILRHFRFFLKQTDEPEAKGLAAIDELRIGDNKEDHQYGR